MSPSSDPAEPRILLREDFVSVEESTALVEFFPRGIARHGYHHRQDAWSFRVINSHRLTANEDLPVKVLLDEIQSRVVREITGFFAAPRLSPQVSQIVIWPQGSEQELHYDQYFSDTLFSAIIYLNDDFDGGAMVVEDLGVTVVPRRGLLVVFDGPRLLHRVDPIRRGTRYTNAIWLGPDSAAGGAADSAADGAGSPNDDRAARDHLARRGSGR